MALKKVHHHGFTVSSIDKSLTFYRDVLGMEVIRISERKDLPSYDTIIGHPNIHLKVAILTHPVNDFVLELFEYLSPAGTVRKLDNYFVGASHVAFEVDDIDFMRRVTDYLLFSDIDAEAGLSGSDEDRIIVTEPVHRAGT